MKLLKRLYEIHSPSGKEKQIRAFIESYVKANIPGARFETDKIGNLFITKGTSETYPCVVAHLDQVQRFHSKDFRAVETHDIIFGYSPSRRRKEGLGADDKNGIWIALKCLEKYDAIKIALFVGEEAGCVGSNSADLAFFDDCRFVIEPDRRGYDDVITEIGWGSMCSEEFLADTNPELFGYKPAEGMMTDIEALRDNGLALSCINVSCGYYEPHTDSEFTVKKDLLNCLDFVQHIIENCTKMYDHELDSYPDSLYSGNYYDEYDHYTDMISRIMEANPESNASEAWETYCMNFPGLTLESFEEMFEECRLLFSDAPAPANASKPTDRNGKNPIGRTTGWDDPFDEWDRPVISRRSNNNYGF